ncbi:hypothetical protein ACLKA7_002766 [Drosophila subpalustris]
MRKRRGEIDALCSTLVDSVTLVYPCFLLHFDSVGNVGFLKSVMDRTNNSCRCNNSLATPEAELEGEAIKMEEAPINDNAAYQQRRATSPNGKCFTA